jgi:hypothetical protein
MVLLSFRGRANYTNLSRYSELDEKTYRRWFGKKLDFIEFNRLGNNEIIPPVARKIAVLDASFVSKSGDATPGAMHLLQRLPRQSRKGLGNIDLSDSRCGF